MTGEAPMPATLRHVRCLLHCEKGATAIEYGLIAALVVVVVVTSIQMLGQGISQTLYDKLSTLFG
jgi:Flp pilus assembly pilin Flp